ncbi:hypothetical protein Dimus_026797 [Dionaea muscipula]
MELSPLFREVLHVDTSWPACSPAPTKFSLRWMMMLIAWVSCSEDGFSFGFSLLFSPPPSGGPSPLLPDGGVMMRGLRFGLVDVDEGSVLPVGSDLHWDGADVLPVGPF